MKAFVTGSTGFVGSHLVETLLAAGHEVRALVRSKAKAAKVFGKHRPTVIQGDLDNAEAIATGAKGAEVIFHLAALTAARSPDEFHHVNVAATERLTRLAEGRFVFVSSLAAIGPSAPGRPHRGGETPRPVSPYGRSKLAAEDIVMRHAGGWTIVRPPAVYGPRDTELLRVFKLVKLGIAPVFGTGRQELSLIYVDDLCDAIVAASTLPPDKAWFVTHPETVTTRELVETVGREVRGRAPIVVPVPGVLARAVLAITGLAASLAGRATLLSSDKAPEFLAPAWTADGSPFEAAAGWRAQVDLTLGIQRTASWYRRHGWL